MSTRYTLLVGILIGCVLSGLAHFIHVKNNHNRVIAVDVQHRASCTYRYNTPIIKEVASKKYRRG